MPTPNDIRQQQELLATHRERLAARLQQQAIFGPATEPYILADIRKARTEIARIKAVLRGWGAAVEDLPDDEEPPTPPTPPRAWPCSPPTPCRRARRCPRRTACSMPPTTALSGAKRICAPSPGR